MFVKGNHQINLKTEKNYRPSKKKQETRPILKFGMLRVKIDLQHGILVTCVNFDQQHHAKTQFMTLYYIGSFLQT